MHLAAAWLKERGLPLSPGGALIVDHGLRPGSAKDSAVTASWARDIGFASQILRWRGPKPRSNVEDNARNARYRLLGDWCRAHGVAALLLAHTSDDQAETFLLRLGRGSGVDGLSAMRDRARYPLSGYDGMLVVRPLLDVGRGELRTYLATRGVAWLEDPMNEDPRFARVRIRQAMPALEAAGLSASRIVQASRHLARAREALDASTELFFARHVRFSPDGALFDGSALRAESREIGLRALSAILMRVSGRAYRPRFERLETLYDALSGRRVAQTLCGCQIGTAPRQSQAFGLATLEVRPEKPRKRRTGTEHASQKKLATAAATRGKSPKKGRIIGRLSGS